MCHTWTNQFTPLYIFSPTQVSRFLHCIQSCVEGNLSPIPIRHYTHASRGTENISFEFMNGILSRRRHHGMWRCAFIFFFFHHEKHRKSCMAFYIGYLMGSFSFSTPLLSRNPLCSTLFCEFAPINSVTSATDPFKGNAREFRFAGGSL